MWTRGPLSPEACVDLRRKLLQQYQACIAATAHVPLYMRDFKENVALAYDNSATPKRNLGMDQPFRGFPTILLKVGSIS